MSLTDSNLTTRKAQSEFYYMGADTAVLGLRMDRWAHPPAVM